MIERLTGVPDHVLGFIASGHVTAEDYESVLIPAVEHMIQKRGQVRLLYEIAPTFSGFTAGAMWDDAKVGMGHLTAWERVAVVTDIEWIATAVKLVQRVMPSVKLFSHAQYDDALRWIAA